MKKLKTEEYTYTLDPDDLHPEWTLEQAFNWVSDINYFINEIRTPDERAQAIRRKAKYGLYTEYIIQKTIYLNPEAWRWLGQDDIDKYFKSELEDWVKTHPGETARLEY
jgi:hypothetical protein